MTVKQIKFEDGTKLTTIELGNTISREEKLKKALNGKTFMKFEVVAAPYGGGLTLRVESRYDGDKDEILGMLLGVMAEEIMEGK